MLDASAWQPHKDLKTVSAGSCSYPVTTLEITVWCGGSVVHWALANIHRISNLSFVLYELASYYFQSIQMACVQRRRPLPLITKVLWPFWHTQGHSEVLANGKWLRSKDDLISSQLDRPAVCLYPHHHSLHPPPSPLPSRLYHRQEWHCVVWFLLGSRERICRAQREGDLGYLCPHRLLEVYTYYYNIHTHLILTESRWRLL